MRTLVADDHTLVREGLRTLLDAEPDVAVVGEAQDGRQAVDMAARLRPDVVVMDVAMPRLNGLEATRQILEADPGARVLVLSAHGDDEYVERALAIGAAGYVLKHASLADLATAIREVHAGGVYLSPSIPARLRGAPAVAQSPPKPRAARLTRRETEVLQAVAEGRGNKQTAVALRISIKTVEKHRQSLMAKLDIHDVAGLTRYAIETGCIEGRDRGVSG